MKENISTDVFTLLETVSACKQHFDNWTYFHSLTDERSMYFPSLSKDHFRLLLMDMHQTLNRSQSDKFTFWRIFARQEAKEYEENPIMPSNIAYWRSLLTQHDETITKIKVIRDTQIVHRDKETPPANFVSMAELKKLLIVIEVITLDMLAILGENIKNIPTIRECHNHTLADAFIFIDVDSKHQLLSRKVGPKYDQPV